MEAGQHIANLFIDIIPDMCFVVSSDRLILAYNRKVTEVLGLPPAPGVQVPFNSLLTDDSPRPLLSVLRTKNSTPEAEVYFKAPDGGEIAALLFVKKITGPEKELLYVVARDVSETKQKELDLLRFSNVVHYTVNPIQVTDDRGRMIYVNPAFEKATGYTKEELIGKNPNIVSSRKYSKEFWGRVWTKIGKGEVWNGEVENKRKDGTSIYTQLLISPIIDAEGRVVGYLGSHRDVTKQKELEQQLMHSQKMESLGTLAAGIAHEVGNPLASISSIVQVISRTIDDDSAKEKLKLVHSQVNRITKIIRDLVDFSRPSNYQVQPTDILRTLDEAIQIVTMTKKAKSITFRKDFHDEIPIVSLVPDQLSQVFINILLNAVDAMEGRSGTIDTAASADDAHVTVLIKDTGHGIPEENLEKIFEPFFTTKRVGEGTGMGLWVSYGIMKSFRGDLRVSSAVGGGTTFTIVLPLNTKDYDNG